MNKFLKDFKLNKFVKNSNDIIKIILIVTLLFLILNQKYNKHSIVIFIVLFYISYCVQKNILNAMLISSMASYIILTIFYKKKLEHFNANCENLKVQFERYNDEQKKDVVSSLNNPVLSSEQTDLKNCCDFDIVDDKISCNLKSESTTTTSTTNTSTTTTSTTTNSTTTTPSASSANMDEPSMGIVQDKPPTMTDIPTPTLVSSNAPETPSASSDMPSMPSMPSMPTPMDTTTTTTKMPEMTTTTVKADKINNEKLNMSLSDIQLINSRLNNLQSKVDKLTYESNKVESFVDYKRDLENMKYRLINAH